MLQRSPSYVLALPGHDPVADLLRKVLPKKAAYAAIRWKNVLLTIGTYKLSRRAPKFVRAALRKGAQLQLPKGYDVDTHFNPRYEPVGPAPVHRARRRPVQEHQARRCFGRDRPDRDASPRRASGLHRATSWRRTSSLPRPA